MEWIGLGIWALFGAAQPVKGNSPLLKLATFGDLRTDRGSLRHDANVLQVYGVEADYDAGEVTPEEAALRMERHHIRAVVVTSWSHTPDKPRFRVFAPLSHPIAPAERARLVARLNGALGGILAAESFTLSQSYFVGGRPGGEYRVLHTFDDPEEGFCVDELDDLDAVSVYPTKPSLNGSKREISKPDAPATVEDRIPDGARNKTLVSLAGTLRRAGMNETEILAALKAVNAERCDPALPDSDLESIARNIGKKEAAEVIGRPTYTGPPSLIHDTLTAFQRWLYLPDETAILAVLGCVAANYLPGDPVWLGLVAPPSGAKTEILNALGLLPDVHAAATITPASLLSGTSKKEQAAGAKGGLLREIGDFGILVLKDFGSVLSMRPDAKAEVLAAFREVYDGAWVRHVGTDGGRALSWSGKIGLVFGATPALDSHHSVIGSMGERFLVCRMDPPTQGQAVRALDHTGAQTAVMRGELATAVAALFANNRPEPRALSEEEKHELVEVAYLAVRLRSAVERDRRTGEIEYVHGAEGPARLTLALERLLAGLDTLGVDRCTAFGVVRKVALDSVPPLRRRAYEWLNGQKVTPLQSTTAVAAALGLPSSSARRVLEDLAAYQLVSRVTQGQGKADLWSVVGSEQ